ncbi:MAG TPA: sigma-70 family RNA polymerase sigma factor [Solirubrobacterales bacterium]
MGSLDLDQPFEALALREIERSLHGKLRAHHLSEDFISRWGEDALQRGVLEYLRSRSAGAEIRDPAGFVVQAAYRRAIDELRREVREADGESVYHLLDIGAATTPAAEEVAIERIARDELRQAVASLSPEERAALSLRYFEGLSERRAAGRLHCSERTIRRRLRSALRHLSRALGAPAPEPGSHRGFEIGLAAWASLGGARVVAAADPLGRLSSAFEWLRHGPARLLSRARHPVERLAASEAPERFGAIASGPAGKVIGGCAGAAIVCAAGVAVSGIPLGQSHPAPARASRPTRVSGAARLERPTRPLITQPVRAQESAGSVGTESNTSRPGAAQPSSSRASKSDAEKSKGRREAHHAEDQYSGVSRGGAEPAVESPPSASDIAPAETAPSESEANEPSASVEREEQHSETQLRGPLAR